MISGGVKDLADLKSRVNSYNTGRAEGDLMHVIKIYQCHSYRNIEDRVGTTLAQFRDKPNSRKEMVHIRYSLLIQIIDFICTNYDQEINYINNQAQLFLTKTIEGYDPIQLPVLNMGAVPTPKPQIAPTPEPLPVQPPLASTPEPQAPKPKKEKALEQCVKKEKYKSKIDITQWDDNKIHETIQNAIAATTQNRVPTTPIDLKWGTLTPHLPGPPKPWRDKFKSWITTTKTTHIKIKGLG